MMINMAGLPVVQLESENVKSSKWVQGVCQLLATTTTPHPIRGWWWVQAAGDIARWVQGGCKWVLVVAVTSPPQPDYSAPR